MHTKPALPLISETPVKVLSSPVPVNPTGDPMGAAAPVVVGEGVQREPPATMGLVDESGSQPENRPAHCRSC